MTEKQAIIFWHVFWSIFVVVGAGGIIYQSWLMRTYSRVAATIISTGVERSYNRRVEQPEATPRARYEFQFRGRTYRDSEIYALPVVFAGNGGSSMAEMIAEQYRPGDRVVAFVDANDPTQAFIRPSFLPYIFPLFAGTMIFAGLVARVRSRSEGTPRSVAIAALAGAALLCGVGVTWHYYWISPGPHESLPALSLLCYAALWIAVLANSTLLKDEAGWQGAVRSGLWLAVVGLYLGLMLWVVMLVVGGWLRWAGIDLNIARYAAHFMLGTGGVFLVLGALSGFFGVTRFETPTRKTTR